MGGRVTIGWGENPEQMTGEGEQRGAGEGDVRRNKGTKRRDVVGVLAKGKHGVVRCMMT